MKKFIKLILRWIGVEGIIGLLFYRSALNEDGWFLATRKNKAIDKNNNPIPWITYPCIDFLKERIIDKMNIFEYGAGGSSVWLSSIAGHVDSVEHSKDYYDLFVENKKNISNLNIYHVPLDSKYDDLSYEDLGFKRADVNNRYVNSIRKLNKKYDIVIVDGIFRVDCILESINHLTDSGVIILDNTNYINELSDASIFMESQGFRRLDFWGMTPIIWAKSCTTIFYKSGNCFNI